jgi:predicted dehydrogenase
MAANKIRLGIIGANINTGWAPRSHLPALASHPDIELAAVCTTKQSSADETAKKYNVPLAFDDHRKMLDRKDIDAVAVVVRVPSHYQPTIDAIEAGKHVYTEWPLGKTLAEAKDMAERSNRKGVRHMVGLQSRANSGMIHMKKLIAEGYVGEMMACLCTVFRDGILARHSSRTWQRDDSLGANILTIPFGHTADAFRFVVGDYARVNTVVSTQVKQWLETDTKKMVDVTAPDQVLVSGRLKNGAVASMHVGTIPYGDSGFRIEVYGREGTLVASAPETPQLVPIRLQGMKAGEKELKDIAIPGADVSDQPNARIVAAMYSRFAEAIRSGRPCEPSFDTAVEMHRFLDTVRASSDQGKALDTNL